MRWNRSTKQMCPGSWVSLVVSTAIWGLRLLALDSQLPKSFETPTGNLKKTSSFVRRDSSWRSSTSDNNSETENCESDTVVKELKSLILVKSTSDDGLRTLTKKEGTVRLVRWKMWNTLSICNPCGLNDVWFKNQNCDEQRQEKEVNKKTKRTPILYVVNSLNLLIQSNALLKKRRMTMLGTEETMNQWDTEEKWKKESDRSRLKLATIVHALCCSFSQMRKWTILMSRCNI